jgi:hypothetical protein
MINPALSVVRALYSLQNAAYLPRVDPVQPTGGAGVALPAGKAYQCTNFFSHENLVV